MESATRHRHRHKPKHKHGSAKLDRLHSFGEMLLAMRLAAGLTQEELSGLSGLSVRTISDAERGQRQTLRPMSAYMLALALRLSATDRRGFLDAVSAAAGDGPPLEVAGAELASLRLAAGLTQESLARQAGVTARTIRDIERGRRYAPRPATVWRLADALGLDGERRRRLAMAISQPSVSPNEAGAARRRAPEPAILGRETELAAIEGRLQAGERLLTLVGPGGIGKSRLARAVAERGRQSGAPVLEIALDAISSTDLVLPAIARAAEERAKASPATVEHVAATLSATAPLLVLDNFEHLLGAATTIAELLEAAPGVAALVTSREALRVEMERTFVVGPLAVPAPDEDPEAALANPAVSLFLRTVERRAGGRPGARERVAEAVGIVRRLDGLPLAIELAAAQAATVRMPAVATTLEAAGLVAPDDEAGSAARFTTMDAAIAWSADLLPPMAQRLFRMLAAFHGGFTGEAVFGVAEEQRASALLGALPRLAEAHLIDLDPGDPAGRMRMLEPIRLFARDQLRKTDEEAEALRAHSRWYLRWARERAREAGGIDPVPALDALDADLANLQTAFANADPADALVTASALSQYWEVRTRFREGRAILAAAISASLPEPASVPLTSLMDALLWSGYLAYLQSDLAGIEEAIAGLQPLTAAASTPELAARAPLLEVLRQDLAGLPSAEVARTARTAYLPVADGPRGTAWFMGTVMLGNLLVQAGEVEEALPLLREYAEWARQQKAAGHREAASYWLGFALLANGELEEARERFAEAISWTRKAGFLGTVYMPLMGFILATGATTENGPDLERAAVLLGALLADSDRHGFPFGERYAADIAATRERMAGSLGTETLEALLQRGRIMEIADALELVEAEAGP